MPGPVIRNPLPEWFRPEAAAADPPKEWLRPDGQPASPDYWTRVLRRIGTLTGANDPQQIMSVAGAIGIPGGEASPAAKAVQAGAQYLEQKFPKLAAYAKGAIQGYHGSPNKFTEFDLSKAGSTTDAGYMGNAAYFSTDKNVAAKFPNQYSAELQVKNPLHVQMTKWEDDKSGIVRKALGLPDTATAQDMTVAARSKGFDSVVLDYSPLGYKQQEIAVFDAAQIKNLSRELSGIKAYHGSPHDFDKFSLEKIGTGEGAQAYGHGLYFAENPQVATEYRDALAQFNLKLDGQPLERDVLREQMRGDRWQKLSDAQHVDLAAKDILLSEAKDMSVSGHGVPSPDDVIERAKGRARVLRGSVKDGSQHWSQVESHLESLRPKLETHQGRMYEVAIQAHPDQFLDWDKPLSQQSEPVKKAIRKLSERAPAVQELIEGKPYTASGREMTGNEFYHYALAGDQYGHEAASDALRQAGIPGIKYLDQGSRWTPHNPVSTNGGQTWMVDLPNQVQKEFVTLKEAQAALETAKSGHAATRNFVVFDDSLIDIMRKYGVVLPMGAGLAALSQQQPAGAAK